MKIKTKKRLEELLRHSYETRLLSNRARQLVNLMTKKSRRFSFLGTFYLRHLMKDENKYLAGAASSAYAMITGDFEPIRHLQYGGFGITLKEHTGEKIVGEQNQYYAAKGKGLAFYTAIGRDFSFNYVLGEGWSFNSAKGYDQSFLGARGRDFSFCNVVGKDNSFNEIVSTDYAFSGAKLPHHFQNS